MAENVKTFEQLLEVVKASDKNYNITKITSAYEFAAEKHKDQKRESGEPYITHPLSVAYIILAR